MSNPRLDLYNSQDTHNRIAYLRKVINLEIPLKPGQVNWLSQPCDIQKNIAGEYKKIGSGQYGKVYKVCIDKLCDYSFILKEIQYITNKYYVSSHNPYRAENVEVKILKLLNDLVYIAATPHVPIYLGDFNCKINQVDYRYLMVEEFDTDLLHISLSDIKITRNVLFQILYTLRIIHKRYPDFIHNDLKSSNVLISNPKNTDKYYKYTVDNQTYYLPSTYRTALWDFGISSMICQGCDNISVEDLVSDEKLGIQTERNQYKDIYKLFKAIIHRVDKETSFFIKRYLYEGEDDQYDNLIPNVEPFTLQQMLNDDYFSSYKQEIDNKLILESYSDENVTNPELVRFAGISNITQELTFDCQAYLDNAFIYFTYRDAQYNNSYRNNCLSSINQPSILNTTDEDYLSVIAGVTTRIDQEAFTFEMVKFGNKHITEFNTLSLEDQNVIIEKYQNLMDRFVTSMYVNRSNVDVILRLVILKKAVFIVTGIHYSINLNHRQFYKYLDYTIQFNEFLCHYPN